MAGFHDRPRSRAVREIDGPIDEAGHMRERTLVIFLVCVYSDVAVFSSRTHVRNDFEVLNQQLVGELL